MPPLPPQADKDVVIDLNGVTKTYPSARSPGHNLWRALAGGTDETGHRALDGVNLAVRRGECVGILGFNGAGKSTLLGIVTGTLTPTRGSVRLVGTVAPLLELGAGYNLAWTARVNVEFQARVANVPAAQMSAHVQAVREFAEIGDFFDQPMRTYSSGMVMRVAFAAAITVDPDILIVDEALAVGDSKFQTKCYARIEAFRRENRTILLVTHSPEIVSRLCTRGIILQGGRITFDGAPRDATRRYLAQLYQPADPAEPAQPAEREEIAASGADGASGLVSGQDAPSRPTGRLEARAFYNLHERRTGDGRGRIVDAIFQDASGPAEQIVAAGEQVEIVLRIQADLAIASPTLGFVVRTVDNVAIYGSSSYMQDHTLPHLAAGGEALVKLSFRCGLIPGEYFLDLGFAEVRDGKQEAVDFRLAAIHFFVTGSRATAYGIADLDGCIELVGT